MITDNHMSLSFSRTMPSIFTENKNNISEYMPTAIRIDKYANGKRVKNADEIDRAIKSVMGDSRESKKFASALLDNITFKDVGPLDQQEVEKIIDEDWCDIEFLKGAIEVVLNEFVPGYNLPKKWQIGIIKKPGGKAYIVNDLPFLEINKYYNSIYNLSDGVINLETLLTYILDARTDMDLASNYMYELVTKDITSSIILRKISRILERRSISIRDIGLFQEAYLGDARAVREAINSGERTFSDFMPILRKSEKFKNWLSSQNPDSNILNSFYRESTSESWIESLPVKSVRYIVTNTVGLFGLIPHLAAAAANEFIIERIFKGWRPNQFVNGPLRKFTSID